MRLQHHIMRFSNQKYFIFLLLTIHLKIKKICVKTYLFNPNIHIDTFCGKKEVDGQSDHQPPVRLSN